MLRLVNSVDSFEFKLKTYFVATADFFWRRGKEDETATKEKMDGLDTWSNWNEAGGTKRCDDRKEALEKACHDSH